MRALILLFTLGLIVTANAASSRHTMSGKVKSFDAKTVRIEADGHLMEFDIKRVMDKTKLRVGQTVEIDLDRKI